MRPAAGPQGFGDTRDTGKIAVFHVTRVWKGDVGPTFEMPALVETSACWGFWSDFLKVGNDLLVFAFRVPGEVAGGFIFETGICSRTALAKDNEDIRALGPGFEPTVSASPNRVYFMVAAVTLITLSMGIYLVRARSSARNQ
jgi:hypothetical protein